MDKDAAINSFIKANYKLLTNKEIYDKTTYKKLKHEYFVNKCKLSGSVKDKEIVDKLIVLLIKNHSIKSIEDLGKYMFSIPFIKNTNVQVEEYDLLLKQLNKEFTDMQLLRNLEDDKKIELLKKDIIQKREPELIAEIEKKKLEKDQLDKEIFSILDDIVFEEPNENELGVNSLEWWEELNLISNPFPSSNGFSMIEENLFERILVGTEPFQWMWKKLTTNTFDFFGKGFLVEGALGTGKTTFYDYFKPQFILRKIEPVRIIIPEKMNVPQYNLDFENQLTKKIKSIYHTQNIKVDNTDYEELMMELQISKRTVGFVIYIDDLHKNINQTIVFDFLSSLQLYKNRFHDNSINIAFFISGLPEWREKIKLDQKLTSFFDAPLTINMPQISPEQAAEAIQKRLSAFSKTNNRSFQISKKFLQHIFGMEEKKRVIVGFRAYIEAAKQHFETKQFNVLGLAPSIIPAALLSNIKEYLENDKFFKESLNKLIFSGGKISNKTLNKCIDLLRHIYLDSYILEIDAHFENKNNLMILKRLADSNLLLKSKAEKGAWKVHPILVELNNSIKSNYGYSLEDYLVQLYGINEDRKPSETNDSSIHYRKKIKTFSAILSPTHYSTLERIVDEILVLYNSDKESEDGIIQFLEKNKFNFERIKYLINSFAFYILDLETPSLSDVFGKNEIRNWSLRFRNLEYLPDFTKLVENENKSLSRDDSYAARVISSALKTFEELFNELESSIHARQLVSGIPLKNFNKKYIKNLYLLADHIKSQSLEDETFFEASRKYCHNIEYSYKEYLFISSKLILGSKRYEHYPENIIKDFGRNYVGPEDCYNEFSNIERSGFSKIFLIPYPNNSTFYKYIIQPITDLWNSKDLGTFYNLFIEFDKILSHNEKEKIPYIRKNIKQFINLSSKLLSDFSDRLFNIVYSDSFIYSKGDDIIITYSKKPRGSNKTIETDTKYIKSLPADVAHYNISTTVKESQLFIDSFFTENKLELDLSNLDDVRRIVPGNKYPEQIGTLCYLIKEKKILPLQIYGLQYYFILPNN
ncbi:MAG TPA: hypothetical protein PLZ15_14695 [Melioribacteraceae bacterium]|nr:hypothetical protein [Melioribacteraceae bacterium]